MPAQVERILHFRPGDFLVSGQSHFGFHDGPRRLYAIDHPRHVLGLVEDGELRWTLAAAPVFDSTPNIDAELEFPMYADTLPDGSVVVSNLGNARMYRVDAERMWADVLVDGHALGMADMGNCVVDGDGCIWVNEVTGCRVWRFDRDGKPLLTIGDGTPGFDREPVPVDRARFAWIYDIRRGPGSSLYVLDSGNFALRVIDLDAGRVRTIAEGFGSDPTARWDGPISLALDDAGHAYVGDRFNHVVRRVDPASGAITTIAGRADPDDALRTTRANWTRSASTCRRSAAWTTWTAGSTCRPTSWATRATSPS